MERSAPDRPASTRRGIQSVETGLRVLAALAASGGPASLTSLGVRSGLSPSQTHRYLHSLVAAGMAVQDPASRYDLGPGVIRIGIAALARTDGFARAEAALARFVEDTGWTGTLAVWGETGAVCVRSLPGRPAVMTNVGVGSVLPLLFSATGHVFAAFLPEPELAGPLAAGREAGCTAPDAAAIRRAVRQNVLARDDQCGVPGLRAIAAPVFDLQGRLAVVLTALATSAFAPAGDARVAERLLAVARTATEESGGVWPA